MISSNCHCKYTRSFLIHNLWNYFSLGLGIEHNANLCFFVFLKMVHLGLFCLFSPFPHCTIQVWIDKSVDGVLGAWTQGGRMEGADKSTEPWWHPLFLCLFASTVRSSIRPSFFLYDVVKYGLWFSTLVRIYWKDPGKYSS